MQLVITTSEAGSRKLPTAHEGSIVPNKNVMMTVKNNIPICGPPLLVFYHFIFGNAIRFIYLSSDYHS